MLLRSFKRLYLENTAKVYQTIINVSPIYKNGLPFMEKKGKI